MYEQRKVHVLWRRERYASRVQYPGVTASAGAPAACPTPQLGATWKKRCLIQLKSTGFVSLQPWEESSPKGLYESRNNPLMSVTRRYVVQEENIHFLYFTLAFQKFGIILLS